MRQTQSEAIVQFLSFSGDRCGHLKAIAHIKPRAWQRLVRWLDDVGLSFYFLQKLKDCNATGTIPASALCRLEQNFTSNQLRVEAMAQRFDSINHKFNDAGIRYAAMKGFSLVPQFCPYAPLRHQGDFDYLIADTSVAAAHRVLVEMGYVEKDSLSSVETIFVIPGGRPSRGPEQYSPRAPHAVELHKDLWDGDLFRLPQIPKLLFLDRVITHRWNGLAFPALDEQDAFLVQILHACHHLFNLWIRMSCLLEIGYFLSRQANDPEFWSLMEQRIGDSRILREFVVIVTELASRLFAAPIPPMVQAWGARISPASRIWINHYARRCVFSELPAYQFTLFPAAKFVVFLHQQYREDVQVGKNVVRKRLVPSSRLLRIARSLRKDPSLALSAGWWKAQLLVGRSMFHILAGLRYLWEVPRWRWLNRTRHPAASP